MGKCRRVLLAIAVSIFILVSCLPGIGDGTASAFAGSGILPGEAAGLSGVGGGWEPGGVLLPPDVMPVVFIAGEPYDMGRQYGGQAADYIIRVRDALWPQLVAKDEKQKVIALLQKYEGAIKKDAPEMVEIMKGMAAGAGVEYEDILMINCFIDALWARPEQACTGIAAWGSATRDGKTIAGINFDFMPEPFAYRVVVVAYPSKGNAFISTGYAGTLGNNFFLNDKGLVELNNHGEYVRPQDKGFGVPAMVLPAHIAMSCDTAEQARDLMLTIPKSMGVIRHFEDVDGRGYVVESTAAKAMYRKAGDFGERDYLLETNHWIMPGMADTKWPTKGPGSSEFRYLTVEKYVKEMHGKLDVKAFIDILSSEDIWDGSNWRYNERWSDKVVSGRQLACQIAVPEERTAYICTGDARGIRPDGAPFGTGQFVKYTLTPDAASFTKKAGVYALEAITSASRKLSDVGYLMERGSFPTAESLALNGRLNDAKVAYWIGLGRNVEAEKARLAGRPDEVLALYGEAATAFSVAQAYALDVKDSVEGRVSRATGSGLALSTPADASGALEMSVGETKVLVDGISRTVSAAPSVVDGAVFVPLRSLAEAFGAALEWNPVEGRASYTDGSRTVRFWVDRACVEINGVPNFLVPVPRLIGGRFVVPLSVLARAVGFKATWNKGSGRITINRW